MIFTGQKQTNGAYVLAYAPAKMHEDCMVVLCFIPMDVSAHPFATWIRDEDGYCFWGDYFDSPFDAMNSFELRSAKVEVNA